MGECEGPTDTDFNETPPSLEVLLMRETAEALDPSADEQDVDRAEILLDLRFDVLRRCWVVDIGCHCCRWDGEGRLDLVDQRLQFVFTSSNASDAGYRCCESMTRRSAKSCGGSNGEADE